MATGLEKKGSDLKLLVDYEYDIFVSYARERQTQWWVEFVVDGIVSWLWNESGIRAKVFLDVKTIKPGERWPKTCRHATLSAKCMIAFLSAPYFQSDWCCWEWGTFFKRGEILDCATIVPVQAFDGLLYPRSVSRLQLIDLRDFTATVESFKKTKRALKLDVEIKSRIVPRVAELINKAPPFSPTWGAHRIAKPPTRPVGQQRF